MVENVKRQNFTLFSALVSWCVVAIQAGSSKRTEDSVHRAKRRKSLVRVKSFLLPSRLCVIDKRGIFPSENFREKTVKNSEADIKSAKRRPEEFDFGREGECVFCVWKFPRTVVPMWLKNCASWWNVAFAQNNCEKWVGLPNGECIEQKWPGFDFRGWECRGSCPDFLKGAIRELSGWFTERKEGHQSLSILLCPLLWMMVKWIFSSDWYRRYAAMSKLSVWVWVWSTTGGMVNPE